MEPKIAKLYAKHGDLVDKSFTDGASPEEVAQLRQIREMLDCYETGVRTAAEELLGPLSVIAFCPGDQLEETADWMRRHARAAIHEWSFRCGD